MLSPKKMALFLMKDFLFFTPEWRPTGAHKAFSSVWLTKAISPTGIYIADVEVTRAPGTESIFDLSVNTLANPIYLRSGFESKPSGWSGPFEEPLWLKCLCELWHIWNKGAPIHIPFMCIAEAESSADTLEAILIGWRRKRSSGKQSIQPLHVLKFECDRTNLGSPVPQDYRGSL